MTNTYATLAACSDHQLVNYVTARTELERELQSRLRDSVAAHDNLELSLTIQGFMLDNVKEELEKLREDRDESLLKLEAAL